MIFTCTDKSIEKTKHTTRPNRTGPIQIDFSILISPKSLYSLGFAGKKLQLLLSLLSQLLEKLRARGFETVVDLLGSEYVYVKTQNLNMLVFNPTPRQLTSTSDCRKLSVSSRGTTFPPYHNFYSTRECFSII